MSKRTRKVLAAASLIVLGPLALYGSGLLRHADSAERALAKATLEARSCVEQRGVEYPREPVDLGELQRQRRVFDVYDRCWQRVATDPRFRKLTLSGPRATLRNIQRKEFMTWRCVEQTYRRTTPIPLSGGPLGYPLSVKAGHFAVGSSRSDLEGFYRVAARCAKLPLDSFRGPDGALSRGLTDGSRCIRHEHGGKEGGQHSHGCHSTDVYPAWL